MMVNMMQRSRAIDLPSVALLPLLAMIASTTMTGQFSERQSVSGWWTDWEWANEQSDHRG
jgi:hypothetical protein